MQCPDIDKIAVEMYAGCVLYYQRFLRVRIIHDISMRWQRLSELGGCYRCVLLKNIIMIKQDIKGQYNNMLFVFLYGIRNNYPGAML